MGNSISNLYVNTWTSTIASPFQRLGKWALEKASEPGNRIKNYWNSCSKTTRAAAVGLTSAIPAYALGAATLGTLHGAALAGLSTIGIGTSVYRHLNKIDPDSLAEKTTSVAIAAIETVEDPSELKTLPEEGQVKISPEPQEKILEEPLLSEKFTPIPLSTEISEPPASTNFLKKLIFRVAALARALVLTLGAFFLLVAGAICLAPFTKFGYELWLNSLFAFKVAKEVACESFNDNLHFNDFHLLKGDHGKFQSEFSWYVNLGLLRSAYDKTDDPKLKDQIKFLAANYLAKAAPLHVDQFRYLDPRFDLINQIPSFRESTYHRGSCADDIDLASKFNQELAIGDESPLILTDTDELTDSFSLGFTILTPQNDWVAKMIASLNTRLSKLENPKDLLKKPLNFLFDLTTEFQDCINDKNKKAEATRKLDAFRKNVEQAIRKIASAYPDIDQKELIHCIREGLTCISQVKLGEIAGIKLLSLDPKIKGKALLEKHLAFFEFVDATGLYINRINLYRHVLKTLAFEKDTRYAVKGPENVQYFKNIEDLTRNFKLFSQNEKAYVQILGNGAIKLLKGWVQEIGQTRWEEITRNPALREILDATLYKIKIQYANAELWKDNFTKFSQAIELIHNELAILLELTAPFEDADFPAIYRDQLDFIPDSLKTHVKAGIGKTAMNVFTGINCAIAKTTNSPTRTYCKGLYFEEAGYMGHSLPIQEAISDPAVARVDLYATQFNSNIEIETYHTNYLPTDVIGELQQLLQSKPDIKHLTVSVDCTIDYFHSPKVAELLKTFEAEIQSGKLNFVFFRSGQKFEMLGMDNYYGSPYYMINNGGPQWDAFDEMMAEKAYKTDPLSLQWFCLANRYASDTLDDYRRQVFEGTRRILTQIPPALRPQGNPATQTVRVNTVDPSTDPAIIDIKLTGPLHRIRGHLLIAKFHHNCAQKEIRSDSRASFGFYYPNIINITSNTADSSSSLRISPGLNAEEPVLNFFQEDLLPRV